MPIRSSEILVPPNSWVSPSGTTTFFADRGLVKSIRTAISFVRAVDWPIEMA
jgi:hypothetical protein